MRFLRWLIILFALGISSGKGWATSLLPGDVAFTTINADSNKRFSFVLLTDISDTTYLYFTDNGWSTSTSSWSNTTEGTILWTFLGDLSCGTEVRIDPTMDTASLGIYDEPDLGFNISTAGDAILAYTGTGVGLVNSFVAAINHSGVGWVSSPSGSGQTGLPAELTNGQNAIALTPHRDNWRYNCSVTGGDTASLKAALNDLGNWYSDNVFEFTAPACIAGCATDSLFVSANGAGNSLRFDGLNDLEDIPTGITPNNDNVNDFGTLVEWRIIRMLGCSSMTKPVEKCLRRSRVIHSHGMEHLMVSRSHEPHIIGLLIFRMASTSRSKALYQSLGDRKSHISFLDFGAIRCSVLLC